MARFIAELDFRIIFKTLLGSDFEHQSPLLKFILLYTKFDKHCHVYSDFYFRLIQVFDTFLQTVS
jgi:hypothetical protein